MYRLAFELGIMTPPNGITLGSSVSAGKDWKDFVAEIEKYSEDVQLWFAYHLASDCGKKTYRINKEQAAELIATGLLSQEKETPKMVHCTIDPILAEKWRNVNWYFNRKFHGCHDTIYDDEAGVMVDVQKPLPNDSVTELLRRNGFAARWEM